MKRVIARIGVMALMLAISLVLPANATKRVLFVDSYHQGYAWSNEVTAAVQSVMDSKYIDLKIVRMDTKRNTSEDYKKTAALRAKQIIDTFRPDIVIASDDNASKYLIMPYYKNAQLPFVFCGVNYTAEAYGFPYTNVTGMVERPPVMKLIYSLKYFTRVVKVGYLASDTLTEHKDGMFTGRDVREEFVDRYAKTFSDWKREFLKFQDEVDILIVGNNAGITDWDEEAARRFVEENTRIATGCLLDWMAPYSFLGATRSATEQGQYAAKTALKILNGALPSNFPIIGNTDANIIINMRIAKKLNFKVPNSFRKIADKIIE